MVENSERRLFPPSIDLKTMHAGDFRPRQAPCLVREWEAAGSEERRGEQKEKQSVTRGQTDERRLISGRGGDHWKEREESEGGRREAKVTTEKARQTQRETRRGLA
jgi:hypothetical protein